MSMKITTRENFIVRATHNGKRIELEFTDANMRNEVVLRLYLTEDEARDIAKLLHSRANGGGTSSIDINFQSF